MSNREPIQRTPPKFDLLAATFALAKEKGLTFGEARRELGRRGAAVRTRKNLRIKNHGLLLQRKGLQ